MISFEIIYFSDLKRNLLFHSLIMQNNSRIFFLYAEFPWGTGFGIMENSEYFLRFDVELLILITQMTHHIIAQMEMFCKETSLKIFDKFYMKIFAKVSFLHNFLFQNKYFITSLVSWILWNLQASYHVERLWMAASFCYPTIKDSSRRQQIRYKITKLRFYVVK